MCYGYASYGRPCYRLNYRHYTLSSPSSSTKEDNSLKIEEKAYREESVMEMGLPDSRCVWCWNS
jgi:hypothetical protein